MKNITLFLSMLLFTAFSFYVKAQPGSGSLDATFNPGDGANDLVETTAIQSDGKIIIGGGFNSYNGTTRNRIARINANGSLDTTFNPGTGANLSIYTTAIQSDGKIVIGGDFNTYNGTTKYRIARLNANGTLDATFNQGTGTGAGDKVVTTAIQSDGKIIIGGSFYAYNGTARKGIARLNANGSLDATFNPGTGVDGTVYTTAIQSDGKIIIGGAFTTYNGTARNYIMRLNADGSLDATFNPGTGANTSVKTTAIQGDGKIIIGGIFISYNGTARNRIARLNADGSLDATFNPGTGTDGTVYTTVLQSDGKIIVGGGFTSYNGTARNRIARLNANSSLDATFNPGTGANTSVYTTAIQSDGKIIIGGWFTSYNGTARNYIARINGGAGVGINESNLDKHNFSAYPNPSNGIFQLTFDNMQSSNGELEIYNVSGEKVYTASNNNRQMQIDLSALAKGIYFVKVYYEAKVYNQKIIVQ
ncbi:MAG: T9SS type A sorting domain-containing protein [Bacteroidota bacterium]|nr:T9SS type A sorting domain-containing protein [Bacteroidota bacterium]